MMLRGIDLGSSKQRERSSRSMHIAANKNNFELELIEGKVDQESKEFGVFQRVYASVMSKIMESIGRI